MGENVMMTSFCFLIGTLKNQMDMLTLNLVMYSGLSISTSISYMKLYVPKMMLNCNTIQNKLMSKC